jgi:NAD(P)H-hydrate epimerase
MIHDDDRFMFNPTVLVSGNIEHASWEFLHQLSEYKRVGGIFSYIDKDYKFPEADVLADAVFGIGLKTILREDRAALLKAADKMNYTHVIAIDIPSGINADTGVLMGAGIHADTTITFGRTKTGLVKAMGIEYSGEVIVKDIGIPDEAYDHVRT